MGEPRFDAPREKVITLPRPIFVKGKGLPKDGVCLFGEGQSVVAKTDNGHEWFIYTTYRGREIKVAVKL